MNKLILVNKNNHIEQLPNVNEIVKTNVRTFNNETVYIQKIVGNNLNSMFEDAKKLGIELCVCSGYRSIEEQTLIYDNGNNPLAAIPGASEHHTGLAVDIINASMTKEQLESKAATFQYTKEFTWISNNCYKYGFILRYPSDKIEITGIPYEPWHYRYVGKKAASEIMNNQITLEEYLDKKAIRG
jgi:zinc D-Ala-D-Ala carboxypeptidase